MHPNAGTAALRKSDPVRSGSAHFCGWVLLDSVSFLQVRARAFPAAASQSSFNLYRLPCNAKPEIARKSRVGGHHVKEIARLYDQTYQAFVLARRSWK